MYERVRIMKLSAMTMFNYISNRPLAVRTIIFLFVVTAVTTIGPRPVLADVIVIRTSGNGLLTPGAPATFPGNTAQLDKTLSDLNNFDMDILVTGIVPMGSAVLVFDERVFNNTTMRWLDFHFTVGTGGFGAQPFAVSILDSLFFVRSDAQMNIGGNFVNPPTFDRPTPFNPDSLSWFAGTGVAPGAFTRFSVVINVPDMVDGVADGSARFTLRERATVPEPTTLLLLGTGLAAVAIKTRKRFKTRKSGPGDQ